MDEYEALKASGGEITELDTFIYYKSKSAAGEELTQEDRGELRLASGIVLDEATDGIRKNLKLYIKEIDKPFADESLAILDRFDREDAALAREYYADVREREKPKIIINTDDNSSTVASNDGDDSIIITGIKAYFIYEDCKNTVKAKLNDIINPDVGIVNAPTVLDGITKLQDWAANATHEIAVDLYQDPDTKIGAVGWEAISILVSFGGADVSHASGGIIVGIEKKTAAQIERVIASEADEVAGITNRTVIGKIKDLENLEKGETTLLQHLPDQGTAQLNWKQNSSVLRTEMDKGFPLGDKSVDQVTGAIRDNSGFLKAERNLLDNKGWKYDSSTKLWSPPSD